MKRVSLLLSLLLVISLAMATVTGCQSAAPAATTAAATSGSTATETPKETDTIEQTESPKDVYADMNGLNVTIMRYEYAKFPIRSAEQKVYQWIKEASGVTVNVEAVPDSSYEDKKKILLSTNNLPDITCITINELREYAPMGPFVDLTPFMQSGDMPAYSVALSKIKEAPYLTVNNKTYAFAKICHELMPGGFYPIMRMDLLQKNNLAVPAKIDDLTQLYRDLKKIYLDSYPLTATKDNLNLMSISFGVPYGMGYEERYKKYIYGFLYPEMKEFVEWMNVLYTEGLLDPDFLSNTEEAYQENLCSGKSFSSWANSGFIDEYNATLQKTTPDAQFDIIDPPETKNGICRAYILNSQWALSGNNYVISSKIKEPLPYVHFMDWLYSPEGSDTTNFGKEGETFSYVDGKAEFLPAVYEGMDKTKADEYKEIELGLTLNNFVFYISNRQWFANEANYTQSKKYLRTKAIIANPKSWAPVGMSPPMTSEEVDKNTQLTSKLQTIYEQAIAQFIIGARPISEWDAFVQELKTNGAEEYEKIYNDALARMGTN